jgi:biopolymer transport protein ExbB/TolQ
MALTPSHRATREWPLLLLTLALVGLVFIPLSQALASEAPTFEAWSGWDADRWGRLFLGPAQLACYCCFTWAAFILLSRYLEVRRQRRALLLPLLPTGEGARIAQEDARPLLRRLDQLAAGRPFILVNMIRLALARYAASRSSDAVGQTVRSQAEIEQGRLVAGMATVNYLAWAIPAVGFLGTVVGLAGSLSMAGHLDEETFLGRATHHLTFAFDCTLVALGLSLVLMFLLHAVQRDEEALVLDCQQFCLEHLVNRTCEPVEDERNASGQLEDGPARLHFLGHHYLLSGPTFSAGRLPTCDLAFDREAYPMVEPLHCEILWEDGGFVLYDESGAGTFLNDSPLSQPAVLQAGDRIRLGAGGPVLRFLGKAAQARPLATTA